MKKFWQKFLVSKIGYFYDQLYQFMIEPSGNIKLVPAREQFNPLITILSIKHYQERIKTYPVADKSTVKKALKYECKADNVFAQIGKTQDNETLVNIWQIDNQVNENTPGILVPETFLLAYEKHLISVNCSPLYKEPLFCYSDGGIRSSLATKIIKSPELFLYSIGASSDCPIKQLNSEQMIEVLFENLHKKIASIIQIFHKINVQDLSALVKPVLLSFIAGGGFYLIVTSMALYIKQQQIEAKLSSTAKTANHLISLENKLNKEFQRYNSLLAQLKLKNNVSIVWPIIEPILKDVNLSSISFEQGKYKIRGTANNASMILALLVNNKRLSGAQFDTPVRKYRGKDNFVISFSIINSTSEL